MVSKILTKRKRLWANKFKPDVIRGHALNPNAADETLYYLRLVQMINKMTSEVEAELTKLFEGKTGQEYFAQDASLSAQAKILTNALTKKFEDLFAGNAQRLAKSVANKANKSSSRTLHSSIQQLSGGLSLSTTSLAGKLTDILKSTVSENVALIKSIPAKYLSGVTQAVMRSITTGQGLQDLVPYINKHKGITLKRARVIARDQTRKAFNGLSKGRMQDIGIQEFEWLHTAGSDHPRPLHVAMSGNIYRFDDPPVIDLKTKERGIPGQLPNCRCRMKPVINFGVK
jgi:SPP1 gp7 family putative phage head morphogenesis protein